MATSSSARVWQPRAVLAVSVLLLRASVAVPATSFTLDQTVTTSDLCLQFLELMVFSKDAQLVSVLGSPGVTVTASVAGAGACGGTPRQRRGNSASLAQITHHQPTSPPPPVAAWGGRRAT